MRPRIGYDFEQQHNEDEERRIADTFRVISLGFSNLGGPEVVQEYFAAKGSRSYEDKIYANLGEFYLAKLRYDDAAKTYKAFVALNPFHRSSPHVGMRVVEIYGKGNFPQARARGEEGLCIEVRSAVRVLEPLRRKRVA